MTRLSFAIGSNRALDGLPLFKMALESILKKRGFQIFWNNSAPSYIGSICWSEHNELPGPRLCLDNAILLDKNYLYIDHKGWRDSNSISSISPNYSLLTDYYKTTFNSNFLSSCNPCGPILILLQGGDTHISFTLNNAKRFLTGFYSEVVVRPHPLAKLNPELLKFIGQQGWKISSDFTFEKIITEVRAVLGSSSGGLVKTLGLKIPVAAFGKGVFTGHDIVYDARNGHWTEWLSSPLDVEKRASLLTAILEREYKSRRDGSTLEENQEFKHWINLIENTVL